MRPFLYLADVRSPMCLRPGTVGTIVYCLKAGGGCRGTVHFFSFIYALIYSFI